MPPKARNKDQVRAEWDEEKDIVLLENILLYIHNSRKNKDTGIILAGANTAALEVFNPHFNVSYNGGPVCSRMKVLRAGYNAFQKIVDNKSGWGLRTEGKET